MDGYNPSVTYTVIKRIMDVTFSGLALLVLLPIMLVVALAIKLEDGGPVFYRQERLTQGNRRFMILKFRSMRVNAESDGVAKLSTGKSDPRITRVGRIIRALRIDELPQLLNILKGEMSIIGPRPERPEITEEYLKVYPEFSLRLLSKAGLTGYAQVYGKYNTTPEDKLRMDLMYILKPSILEDIRLMFATVKILFVPESTEGVAEGQTNAIKTNAVQNPPIQ
ncbi:MAG: sugar transferase, partial [Candidatus Fimadaptatus sp.]